MRGDWAETLAPALVTRTIRSYRDKPEQYTRYVRVLNTTNAYEDDQPIDPHFGAMAPKSELGPFLLDKPIKLPGKRFIPSTFALGYLISKEMRDDDKVGLAGALAAALGRSSRITAELWGHDVLNFGFSTTKYTGRDGLALFSTAHTLYGPAGGTAANKPATDVDLSDAALEAALTNFRRQTDERGFPVEAAPRILLISPEQEFVARRILESTGQVGTNVWGSVNVLRDQGLTVIISDWLTDTDAWYLLAAPADVDIRFYWRQRMDTYTWDDLGKGGTYHKIDQRHTTGFADWRGTYGSPGA